MRVSGLFFGFQPESGFNQIGLTPVPGDAADTRVFWYTHPGAKPVFTDGLRVPAGYTESVLVTFPQW